MKPSRVAALVCLALGGYIFYRFATRGFPVLGAIPGAIAAAGVFAGFVQAASNSRNMDQ